jgi:tol-pal system protein YbgF
MPSAQPAPPPAPPVNAAAGMSPQRLYSTAYADFASGQWALAIQGFDAFVRTFPRSEQADDAQFYIGEANVLDGKPQDAVAAYDKVITNYPEGDRVPFALYKRGLVLEGLGQTDRARESYETVIQRFPENEASVLAKQRLDRLPRAGR